MIAVLFASAALAGTPGYQACCTAANAGACPTELLVSGPGSSVTADAAGTTLSGVWTVACDGRASFDPAARQVLAARPPEGGVVSPPISQTGAACFNAACAMPAALCLQHGGDRAKVVACSDGKVAGEALWLTTPVEDTRAAVVDQRVLLVRDAQATPRPATASAGGASGAGAVGAAVGATTGAVATAAATSTTPVDLSIPDAPPDPCKPNMPKRAESQAQVDDGDAAVMKGDHGYALARYRAAITLEVCNPFAWAAMGDTFLALKDAGRAKQVLLIATRLMPTHYQAWTNLGRAHETLGELVPAADAYKKALEVKPGFPPAVEGSSRVNPK